MSHEREVLTEAAFELLGSLGGLLSARGFLLVGGTALAIQRGHRRSIDLDFFCEEEFRTKSLLEAVAGAHDDVVVAAEAENTLNLRVGGVKVDLIRYAYPLIERPVEGPSFLMASLPDIAAMKLSAVTNRGSKKDFFDLVELSAVFSLGEMLEFYARKFPSHDRFFVVRSLTYFDDADSEPDPVTLRGVSWSEVRSSIRSQVEDLAR